MENKNNNRAPRSKMGRGMSVDKPKNFRKSLGKLFKYMGRYKYAIFAVMVMAAISTVFSVAGPKVMGKGDNGACKWPHEESEWYWRN